uniref:Contryphan n=1 Tax=Myoviridae sp. ctfvB24 TaxID=2826679 RepID=A0A8S5M975_9CAUD|nr:MAG TPA: contryphan [Myoviridae sp. ctfvB24]
MTFGVLELYYSCQILFLPGCRKPSLRNSPWKPWCASCWRCWRR